MIEICQIYRNYGAFGNHTVLAPTQCYIQVIARAKQFFVGIFCGLECTVLYWPIFAYVALDFDLWIRTLVAAVADGR